MDWKGGDVLDGGEIGGSVVGSDAAFVITEHHIQNPVQAVFDGPMAADDRPEFVGRQVQGTDIEAGFALYLAAGFTDAFDNDDGLQSGPFVALL